MRALKNFGLILLFFLFIPSQLAEAQRGRDLVVIRDTEIEKFIREWTEPVLKNAGLQEEQINIILVQNNQVNAFVAGGANIFFYTGLLLKTDGPEEVIGVFAHELGHITGGHLIGQRAALRRASYESMLGILLGASAAILTGDGRAAGALGTAGSSFATSRFLAHNRVQESSADQAALTFLHNAEMDSVGLATFLEKLRSQEFLPQSKQSEYVRTHPLTSRRIDAVKNSRDKSYYKGAALPEKWIDQHARMKAKILAYIDPGQIAWTYETRDQSIPALYARAVAAYRTQHIDKALSLIDGLLTQEPENPYFWELKGQMLLEFSRVDEAVIAYEKAIGLMPNAPLIRLALGHATLEAAKSNADLEKAIEYLERAVREEPRSARGLRLLATAYGRAGQENVAKIYLAEEALLQGNFSQAKRQAKGAQQDFAQGSRYWIKAQDIITDAENGERDRG